MELIPSLFISLISFLTCIIVASFLGKSKYFLFLSDREKRFGSIDGIRGFLALSVFFHHFIFTYYWKVDGSWQLPLEVTIPNFGIVGVSIFFMITGFLFFTRIMDIERPVGWAALYKSRIFRIYPLYVFALIVMSLIIFSNTGFQANDSLIALLKQYIKWILFVGGSINQFSETNLIIAGVEWTLKYEWLYYFLLPLIFYISRSLGRWGLFLLVFLAVFLYYKPVQISPFFSSVYLIFFAIGATVSQISHKYKESFTKKDNLMSTLSLSLFILLLVYPNAFDSIHILMMSILFFLVAIGNSMFGIFSTRAAIVLGEISYSIYLLHGIILYIIFTELSPIDISDFTIQEFMFFMPILSIVVVVISTITFLTIERPFIQVGRKFKISHFRFTLTKNNNKK
jgi:peptidoglycan/LPS O-acetylase OafA/YrhL